MFPTTRSARLPGLYPSSNLSEPKGLFAMVKHVSTAKRDSSLDFGGPQKDNFEVQIKAGVIKQVLSPSRARVRVG